MTKPQERQQALKDILEQRVLVLDGAMGTMIHQAPLSIETDYRGRENCPEILNVTRPDVIQRHPPRLSRSRRRHHRDQHLRRRPHRAGRIRARRPRLRAELRRRQTRAPGRRRVLHRRQAALRRRLHRPHHQSHQRHRRRHVRRNCVDGLLRAGARAWSKAAPTILLVETCYDTAQRQSRAARHRTAARANWASESP